MELVGFGLEISFSGGEDEIFDLLIITGHCLNLRILRNY